jgi:hypothetical protein
LIRPDRFERAVSLLCGTVGSLISSGIPVRVLADFWNWEEVEVNSRRGLALLKEGLMLAKRADWTEAHDLSGAFSRVDSRECLIILSDMPTGAWKALVPDLVLDPVVVDIVSYDRSVKRKFIKGKAVAR